MADIFEASRLNNYERVIELLKQGVSPDRQSLYADDCDEETLDGWTPLMHASSMHCGHLRIVELLIEYGANIDLQDRLNASVLMVASYCGHKDIIQLLTSRRN